MATYGNIRPYTQMKITLKKRAVRKQKTWVVDWHPPGGKRQRRFFGTKEEAEKHKAELEEQHNRGGTAWLALTAVERADLITSYEQIRKAGTTLAAVLEYWRRGNTVQQINGCTLRQAVDRCIESRRETNCRDKYIAKLSAFLNRFTKGREAFPVGQIGLKDVQEFLAAGNENGPFKPITRNTYLRYLQVFFNFCAEQKFLASNPIAKQIKNARVDFVEPTILTNEQVTKCLHWARDSAPELLAYVAIALFAGVRPEEIDQMSWDMVELEHGLLRLPAEILKDRRPRQCHLQPVAVEWLKLAKSVQAHSFRSTVASGCGRCSHCGNSLGLYLGRTMSSATRPGHTW